MSHPQQLEFVASVRGLFPTYFESRRVLEVGSLDINGTIRSYFSNCEYIGLDVGKGPGVDVVCQGQDYDAPDGSFDVAVSCEVMEHNPYWRETFENMVRVCRPGGLVIMTCASAGRAEHGTTRTSKAQAPLLEWEYYRNLVAADFRKEIPIRALFSECGFMENFDFCDLYFVGFKGGAPAPTSARRKISSLRWHYFVTNMKNLPGIKRRATVALVGDERYYAGPVRLFDLIRRRSQA